MPPPRPAPTAPSPPTDAGWRGTLRRFWRLAGGYWRGRAALGLGLGLLGLNGVEVALLLRFNAWHRDLFDALERRDAGTVLTEFGVLLLLVGAFAAVSCLHLLARRRIALGWRSWLASRLTGAWLAGAGGAAGAAAAAGGQANADGRIAEDARIATEEAVELAASFTHGLMTLACFVGVLWALSGHPPIRLGGATFDVPGYLLWIAVLYAGVGMAIAALLGRPLVRATDHRQGREADYRAALVRAQDAKRGEEGGAWGAAGPGPAGEGSRLAGLFGDLAASFHRQTRAFAQLQLFCVANTRLGSGLPFVAATPAYLAGVVTLGWVMQAAQAFQHVAGALNWPVDHMPRIATWRASAERVIALHDAAVAAAAAGTVVRTPPAAAIAAGPRDLSSPAPAA